MVKCRNFKSRMTLNKAFYTGLLTTKLLKIFEICFAYSHSAQFVLETGSITCMRTVGRIFFALL